MASSASRLHQRIAASIATVTEELEAEARRRGLSDLHLAPGPPASPGSIAWFERQIGRELPPSMRAFLELHDGYEGLAYGGDMLSLARMQPGSETFDRIQTWKRECAEYGSPEVVEGIVVASSTQPNQWLYLDPARSSGPGELVLVQWLGDTTEELADLFAYFDFVVMACRADLDVP